MRKCFVATFLLFALFIVPVAASPVSVTTGVSSPVLYSGENRTYRLNVVSRDNVSELSVEITGRLQQIIRVSEPRTEEERTVYNLVVRAPSVRREDVFTGAILIRSSTDRKQIPVAVRVVPANRTQVSLSVSFLSERVRVSNPPQVNTRVSRSGPQELNLTVQYELRRSSDGKTVYTTQRNFYLNDTSVSRAVRFPVLEGNISAGSYYIQSFIIYRGNVYTSLDTVQFVEPFWTPLKIRAVTFLIAAIAIAVGGWRARKWYLKRKEEEARYVFPVDYNKLPDEEESYWVGKIAETTKEAYIDPDDLTTHAIVAGSTGAGKSVTASVIVEEALENDVPVVVFDPTAQWTGFVKKCIDDNLLEHYDRFDMDEEDDPHPYKGLIKKIDAEDPSVDFEGLMNPGEVTVFTLDHLSTEEFDTIVRKIIDSIFEV
ncbi:MAG: DUF87 domain-containing protein, partial [Candidatus Nanohaloarchaea archaeon]|nr:DUF87 domain-containing protein [Candidatus Nanohaloarchaea archaeon]